MTVPGRRSSTFTRLLRHGFTDASAAERLLDSAELAAVRDDPVLLDALGATADPDLADLATATLRAALALAEAAAPQDAAACRLAVIAMGKCGGHELNYVSDVDVIFVAEATEGTTEAHALKSATR